MKTRSLTTTIALLFAPITLRAVTDTWDGNLPGGGAGDSIISTALNWADDTAPLSDLTNTDLIFAGTTKLAPIFSAAFNTDSVTFNNTAGAFTLSGAVLTIGTTGIVNNDAQTQSFTNQVTLGTAASTFNAASGALAFGTVALGANTLNFAATAGTSGVTALTGAGTVNKSGAGTLTFGAAGAVTQSWDLVGNLGNFTLNSTTDLTVSTTGSITVNAGSYQANGNLTMNGTPIVLSAANPTFNIAAGKTLTLQNGGSLQALDDFTHAGGGTITATGATSLLSVAGTLLVNDNLNLLAGADATVSTNLNVGSGGLTAALTVDGSGSTLTGPAISGSFVGIGGGNGTLVVSNSASAGFSTLLVAASGATSVGLVSVQSGGQVTANALTMADDAGTSQDATLTVTGAGSALTIGGAGTSTVGAATTSSATVNVQSGGIFTSGTGTLALNATGTMAITGGTFNANGNMTLNGQMTTDATGNFNLAAGRTLTIQNGGDFINSRTYVHTTASTVTVSGAGSSITSLGSDSLRFSGGSVVNVLNGGQLVSGGTLFFAALFDAGNAAVTVDGAGSSLAAPSGTWGQSGNSASVTFSNGATGTFPTSFNLSSASTAGTNATVNVLSGSTLTSGNLNLGATAAAATASLTIDGAGSSMTINGSGAGAIGVTSGGGTSAALNVQNGGVFNSSAGTTTVNTSGAIAITGGTFNANGNLTVNGGQLTRNGAGTFNLATDRTVTVQAGGDVINTGSFHHSLRSNLTITGSGSTFTTGGDFIWDGVGNTLSLISVNTGGLLSSGGALHLGRTNQAVSMTVNGAGAQVVASPSFTSEWQAGVLFINGASAILGGLRIADQNFNESSFSSLNVQSGSTVSLGTLTIASTVATSTGTLSIEGSGSAVVQTGTSALTLGASFLTSATLAVEDGGVFTSGTGAFTFNATAILNVDGGTATFNGLLNDNGGTVNFTSGALLFNHASVNLTVGNNGLLGENLTLTGDKRLRIGGTTTIEQFRTLALTGGTFTTGALVNNGTLDFQKGTLAITGAGGFNIGTGALGSNVTLSVGANLQVTNTATVAAGAALTVNGGTFTAGTLNNSGTIRANLGTASAASGTNSSGGRIFIGDTLDFSGTLTNVSGARITLEDGAGLLSGAGALNNSGLVTGDGTIAKPLTNGATGEVRGELGRTLSFTAAATNSGQFNLLGGTLDFASTLTNNATGFISGRGAIFTAGLTNHGQMAFAGGNTDIRGDVALTAGSRVATSGAGSVTAFYDDVTHNGLEIFTGANASTVFYGDQSGAGSFTGTGTVYFIGDLRPGNSPASVRYEGDVIFGSATKLTLELGGLVPGAEYDTLDVAGTLVAGGALEVLLYGGFTPRFGDAFDLFDAGNFASSFDTIALPDLSGGLEWDATQLQSTGQLRVVPEPSAGMLALLGTALLGLRRRSH